MIERINQIVNFEGTSNLFMDIQLKPGTDYQVELKPGACILVHRDANEQMLVVAVPLEPGFDVTTIIPDGVRGGTKTEKTRVFENTFGTNTPDQQGIIKFTRT